MNKWEYKVVQTRAEVSPALLEELGKIAAMPFFAKQIRHIKDDVNRSIESQAEELTEALLNEMGKEGWELVNTYVAHTENDGGIILGHILKRPR